MKRPIVIISLLCLSLCASFTGAAEPGPKDQQPLLDKIQALEKQIAELKSLKLKKQALPIKMDQCMKVVGIETYCTCITDKLPAMVDYRQFVQILLTPANEFGYDKMNDEQKKDVDQALVSWAKCVDYKGPKGKGLMDGLMNRETLF